MHTASTAFLEALNEAGVSYIFANLGRGNHALIEALAEARAAGLKVPKSLPAPMRWLRLAQRYAQMSSRAQAVIAGTFAPRGSSRRLREPC